jgi:serpin B
VQEEGTEAAAATAKTITTTTKEQKDQPKFFRADHPFLFFIRDQKTGTILLMGRVENPAVGK